VKGENERFKDVRLDRKKNQVEFGDLIGRPQSYISAIEHGRKPVTYELLRDLLISLDVNPAYIIVGAPYKMYMAQQRTTSEHPDILREEVEAVEYARDGVVEKELNRIREVEKAANEFRQRLQSLSRKGAV
jgi:transcriptional regulator with XRE-family HTH domain